MKILVKNGRLIDPASGLDQIGDLAIACIDLLWLLLFIAAYFKTPLQQDSVA